MAEGKSHFSFDPADTIVELQTTDNRVAIQKIMQSQWKNAVREDNGESILLNIHKNEIPSFAKDLINQDIKHSFIISTSFARRLFPYPLQPRTGMWKLLKIELFKIFRRPRTYIAFAAIAAIIFLIQLAFYSDGEAFLQFGMQSLKETFDINGKILSGYMVCFIILQTLLIHVPLLIALVAGRYNSRGGKYGHLAFISYKANKPFTIYVDEIHCNNYLYFIAIGFYGSIIAGGIHCGVRNKRFDNYEERYDCDFG